MPVLAARKQAAQACQQACAIWACSISFAVKAVPEVIALFYYMNEWKEVARVFGLLAASWIPSSAFGIQQCALYWICVCIYDCRPVHC